MHVRHFRDCPRPPNHLVMTLNVTEGDVRLRRPTAPVCLAGHVMDTESFTVILALMMVPESM